MVQHGCTEQIVSQIFPDVILIKNKEFDFKSENFAERYQRVLSILRSRQNSEGAFGYWTANASVFDYQTVYATHFLMEARQRGLEVPGTMISNALTYLDASLNSDDHSLPRLRLSAYSIYLMTRNGTVTTNQLTALRENLDQYFPETWKKDVSAALMAATYKLLKLDREAEDLIAKVPVLPEDASSEEGEDAEYDDYYDTLLRNTQYLYLISLHFPERAKNLSGADLMAGLKEIEKGSFNTLTSAYTVLAIDAYSKAVGTPAQAGTTLMEISSAGEKNLGVAPGTVARSEFSDQAQKIRYAVEGSLPLFYQLTESGFDTKVPTTELHEGIEVVREFRNMKGEVVTKARQGEDLQVHLVVRSLNNRANWNVAIVDLLPGGSEIKLPINRGINTVSPLLETDYIDVREDRMIIYATVLSEARHFYYQIKCTQRGSFEIPAVLAESMYNRRVRARTVGGRLEVE
jgi:alpha-2-macroglobulin